MNKFIAKYFFYYPITLLKGELIFIHKKKYNEFQFKDNAHQEAHALASLNALLSFAKTNSKHYAETLENIQLPLNSLEDMQRLPLLTKQLLISNIEKIKTFKAQAASQKTTGGSTGEPVKLYKNSDALARERTATWRSYEWAGVGIGDKQARFWGVPHSTAAQRKSRIIDFVSNRLRISAFSLSDEAMKEYYQQLLQFKPKYLYGYVSVIYEMTLFLEKNNLPPIPSIESIITTSEVLTSSHKTVIERYWQKRVFNEYGCGEVGSIAHECEKGKLHLMSDNLYVECIDANGKPAETGEIVITDFFNYATPLIRYRIGDFATLSNQACTCAIKLPVIENIHGRAYDLIKTSSGKTVHPEAAIYIFEDLQKERNAFSQFQIVQDSLHSLQIYIIKTPLWSDDLKNKIRISIQEKISADIECEFHFVDCLTREKSGKMRVVKSLLSQIDNQIDQSHVSTRDTKSNDQFMNYNG